ncbi:hypothetical protein [Spirosoma oryzicola]|uniref:hypothetical protein n=1 Tax=Spirosoma oryzicola TaxID=2898794 RepID=UPI001E5429BB|nr:hypothetical protein [Spirosoma oryzicola]UHG93334.1 hypothetical protein LQ777_10620 [Spirosoma oryzicola]
MIELRIDGQVADLPPAATVGLELTNPFLTYETLFTQKATWPAMALTPLNRQLLGFADSLQVAGASRYNAQTFYGGQLLQEGVGFLTDPDGQGYQLAVDEPLGEFFGRYQTIPLNELPLPIITFPADNLPREIYVDGKLAVCFPEVINPGFVSNSSSSPSIYSGRMNDAQGVVVPAISVRYLLQQLASLTGSSLTGTLFDHPQISKLILMNTQPLATPGFVPIASHLPAWTIGMLLLELRKVFNFSYRFKAVERKLTMGLTDDIFRQPAGIDWSDRASRQYKKRQELNRRLQLTFELDGNDQLLKDRPSAVADHVSAGTDPGIAKVSSKLCPILFDPAQELPIMSQASGSTVPRLAFWNGGKATNSLGDITLTWAALREKFWAQTERFRAGMFYAERSLMLTPTDLAQLDFARKVHVVGVDYLVARIVVNLPVKQAAQCLLIRA